MKITFHGAAKMVTGSKHLLTLKNGKKILLDCGLFQGRGKDTWKMNKGFNFSAREVDYMILSHAHIDHSGNIPNLVKHGFRGKIYCTPSTLALCELMLRDSAHIQESDAKHINKYRLREGKDPIEPLYTMEDAEVALKQFSEVPYDLPFKIDEDCELLFTDAGHILGSAITNLTITENGKQHKLCYTGDVGRFINKLLKRPQAYPQAKTIICESTYGNRLHGSIKEAQDELQRAVHETCVMKKGKLIIPAFSVGKTQELVYYLDRLETDGLLPRIKVYVDSPLAINATEIIRKFKNNYSDFTKKYMEKDPDPFGFNGLHYVREIEMSKRINDIKEPCIIISASGMAEAGRIRHHIAHAIQDPKNAMLIIGYSSPSSLAGRLLRGDKRVSIFGKEFDVKMHIYRIDFFSAHADQNELLQFLSMQDRQRIENIFLVHGNVEAQREFKDKLYEKGFFNVEIAEYKESYYV
ncbi:MAG: MBL fold metallo-hydrolase [Flavobacteriales bacterium]|nr:MBL fold metallo-hydrolase [Flavobacteriales bacterium]